MTLTGPILATDCDDARVVLYFSAVFVHSWCKLPCQFRLSRQGGTAQEYRSVRAALELKDRMAAEHSCSDVTVPYRKNHSIPSTL